MKNLTKNIFQLLGLLTFALTIFSCHRADEDADVLSQEDISNIILNVKDDATGTTATYNYTANATAIPTIKLTDGKSYTVSVIFKNGNEDATQEILQAKNEHFLIFNFIESDVILTRIAGTDDLRNDSNRVGLTTKWQVIKAINGNSPQLILTLNHAATRVSEAKNGTAYGNTTGGETDAVANFGISN